MKASMHKKRWTEADLAVLRTMYPHQLTSDVAKALGRSEKSCYFQAHLLNIHKTEAFYRAWPQGHATPEPNEQQKRNFFKGGFVPWNKGLKGISFGGKATQFKPGNMPQNWLPVGSYRVIHGSILEIKWRDCPGHNHMRWKPVSRLVWEAYHGLVPKGSIVVFKPGTQTVEVEKIRIENLECITRAEHACRNHPNSRYPEYAQLCQLKGAITRQVNRIAREAAESKP